MIFPVDNAIKCLSNFSRFPFSCILLSEFRIPEVGAFHRKNSWFSGLQNQNALALSELAGSISQSSSGTRQFCWAMTAAYGHNWSSALKSRFILAKKNFRLVELALSICELAPPVGKFWQMGKRRKLPFIWKTTENCIFHMIRLFLITTVVN